MSDTDVPRDRPVRPGEGRGGGAGDVGLFGPDSTSPAVGTDTVRSTPSGSAAGSTSARYVRTHSVARPRTSADWASSR